MDAVVMTPYNEEVGALTAVLQHIGLTVRSTHSLTESMDQPASTSVELYLLALDEINELTKQSLHCLSGASDAPIILIVDECCESTQIELYQTGVDLVILRPFSPRLLVYQARALLQRTGALLPSGLPSLVVREFKLDPVHRHLTQAQKPPIRLTQLEFRLLHLLMMHPNQTLPTQTIVESVWGYAGEGNRELLRGLIQRLRLKIEDDPHEPTHILTEPGIGYIFNPALDG